MLAGLDDVTFYEPGSRSNAGVDWPPRLARVAIRALGYQQRFCVRRQVSALKQRAESSRGLDTRIAKRDAHTPTPSPRLWPAQPRSKRASHHLLQRGVDHSEVIVSANDLDVGHPQHALQLAGGNGHGARPRRSSRCRLRECSRHRRMKTDIALNLLH